MNPLTLRNSLIGASLLAASSLSAATIPLINPSFEATDGYNGGVPSSIPGWSDLGGTYGDISNVTSQFTSGLSEANAIYVGGGILQVTSATFVTGATYTVSLDLGNPSGIASDGSGVIFGLRNVANNSYLPNASLFGGADGVPDGTFQNLSFTYTATAGDAGNAISIGIEDFYQPSATYRVDNVNLTTSAVPEPSAFVIGVAGFSVFAFARMRQRLHRA